MRWEVDDVMKLWFMIEFLVYLSVMIIDCYVGYEKFLVILIDF